MSHVILHKTVELLREAQGTLRCLLHRPKAYRTLASYPRPFKLHLACGSVHLKEWINIDADSRLSGADIIWDLRHGIPVDNDSCSFIYCEHFLEHLPVQTGVAFLRECRRVLNDRGIMRVAMPSLDVLIQKSASSDWKDQDWLKWPEHERIATRAEMLNIAFRSWGHEWLYDQEELHRRLHEAGFQSVKDRNWGESDAHELRHLETRKDSLLICEASH